MLALGRGRRAVSQKRIMIQNVEEGGRLAKEKYRFWSHLYFCRRRYRLGLMAKKCLNRKQMTLYALDTLRLLSSGGMGIRGIPSWGQDPCY